MLAVLHPLTSGLTYRRWAHRHPSGVLALPSALRDALAAAVRRALPRRAEMIVQKVSGRCSGEYLLDDQLGVQIADHQRRRTAIRCVNPTARAPAGSGTGA